MAGLSQKGLPGSRRIKQTVPDQRFYSNPVPAFPVNLYLLSIKINHLKNCIVLLLLATLPTAAQKKADRKTLENLQNTVSTLTADSLQGRQTGTPGETRAAAWISAHMQQDGLAPKGDSGFFQYFVIKDAVQTASQAQLRINDHALTPNEQFYALPFSATKAAKGDVIPHVNEPNNIWLVDLSTQEIPADKVLEHLRKQAAEAIKTAASAVVFYNGNIPVAELEKWGHVTMKPLSIPVLWITAPTAKQYMGEDADNFSVDLKVAFEHVRTRGTNVIGFIDNGAPQTVIVSAAYDCPPAPKNEDKASATAALLELGRLLKTSKLHNNNYLLVAVSGQEQGGLGNTWFDQHRTVDSNTVNYMVKLAPLGHADKGLRVQGGGSANAFKQLLTEATPKSLKVTVDEAALPQSSVPALAFSAPEDAATPVNYSSTLDAVKMVYTFIEKANSQGKLAHP